MEARVTCALCNSFGSKNDNNFLPNTDVAKKDHAEIHLSHLKCLEDGITEDEMRQRCFFTTKCQPKVERPTLSQSECRGTLRDLCKSLAKHHSKGGSFVCNMCGYGISVSRPDYKVARSLRQHACAHMEVKPFKCRHCDLTTTGRDCIQQHIRRMHNMKSTRDEFEDNTVEQFYMICDRIKRCFSSKYPRANGAQCKFIITNDSRTKSQRSITDLCHSIFIQRSKPASLECNLCRSQISLQNRMRRLNAPQMYHHAAAHMEVKLFTCRYCDQAMSTRSAVGAHLRAFHQIFDGRNGDDFVDQSEKFNSEHLNTIERCFSAGQNKLEDERAFRSEAALLRNHIRVSKRTIERHLFCRRLIRTGADRNGKIKCSLCSKHIAAKVPGRIHSKLALLHAEMHLKKPLYQCKMCKRPFSTHKAIEGHLKSKHALGMEKNQQCVADEFHEEIMAVLSKCFAVEGTYLVQE